VISLRDRFRRWWRPAQWNDDHPLEAKESRERSARKKPQRMLYNEEPDPTHIEQFFKKPR